MCPGVYASQQAATWVGGSLERSGMKLTGFLLLISGWGIVVAALLILPPVVSRVAFLLAGVAVQILGLVLMVRSHRVLDAERG